MASADDPERLALDAQSWRRDVLAAGDGDERADLIDAMARQAAAAGDVASVGELIWVVDELHLSRSSIRRLVVQDDDAEEVEQDVLVAVAETIGSFRGDARFTTWLHQVARHKAIAHLRRRRATVPLQDDDHGDAARISSMIATRTVLDAVIRDLPDLYRDAVVRRDVEGRPYAEVAELLDLNLNTVKARVARGRALAAAQLRSER